MTNPLSSQLILFFSTPSWLVTNDWFLTFHQWSTHRVKLGETDSPPRAGHLFGCTYYTSYCLLELLNHEPESTEMMSGIIYCLLNMWWLLRTCMDGCVSSLPNPVTRSKMIKINNVWIALFVVCCCFTGMPTVRLFNNLILIMHFLRLF